MVSYFSCHPLCPRTPLYTLLWTWYRSSPTPFCPPSPILPPPPQVAIFTIQLVDLFQVHTYPQKRDPVTVKLNTELKDGEAPIFSARLPRMHPTLHMIS